MTIDCLALSARQWRGRRVAGNAAAAGDRQGRMVREAKKVAILSLGTRLEEALKAADALDAAGFPPPSPDLRLLPLDEALIRSCSPRMKFA